MFCYIIKRTLVSDVTPDADPVCPTLTLADLGYNGDLCLDWAGGKTSNNDMVSTMLPAWAPIPRISISPIWLGLTLVAFSNSVMYKGLSTLV